MSDECKLTGDGMTLIQLICVRNGWGSDFMRENPTAVNTLIARGLVHPDTLSLTEAGTAMLSRKGLGDTGS